MATKNDLLQQIHEDRRKDKKKFFVAKKVAIAILLQFYWPKFPSLELSTEKETHLPRSIHACKFLGITSAKTKR